jgi:hypothetical protein
MYKLFLDQDLQKVLSDNAIKYIAKNHTGEFIGKKMKERLELICKNKLNTTKLNLEFEEAYLKQKYINQKSIMRLEKLEKNYFVKLKYMYKSLIGRPIEKI